MSEVRTPNPRSAGCSGIGCVITDHCPRCGWHGYFHHYLATIDRDWAVAVCDSCHADLHPGITVTVKFYSARWPSDGRAVAAIRQCTRSDHDRPGIGQFPRYRADDYLAALVGAHPDAGR
jgi:hypothetical protein